jgi:hypothetical protein
MALQLKVPGRSTFTEKIYPSRFMHAAELQRMGAEIAVEGATAAVYGDKTPFGCTRDGVRFTCLSRSLYSLHSLLLEKLGYKDFIISTADMKNLKKGFVASGADIERLPSSAMPKGFAED